MVAAGCTLAQTERASSPELTIAGILRQEHVRELSPALERIPMVPGAWPEPARPQQPSAGEQDQTRSDQKREEPVRARCERKRYVDFTPAQLYKRWKQAKAERGEQDQKSKEGKG